MQEKPNKWRPAIIAGLAIGAVSGLPVISFINCCCCAGILGGGVFAYYLYRQEHQEGMPPLESSDGLILGIMAGVIGAFVQTLLHGLIMVLFAGAQEELSATFSIRSLIAWRVVEVSPVMPLSRCVNRSSNH
jgi:hypothetical protein